MDESEADKAAIMAVIRAETGAWLQRDFEALASHWVQSPQSRIMTAFSSLGVRVDEGWDMIAARYKGIMERFPQKYDVAERIRWKNINIVVGQDMAWATYDQIAADTGDGLEIAGVQHELKVFHRVDGAWKIACIVLMQRTAEQASCPLIQVDADLRILWSNQKARDRMRGHPGLVAAAGHLRARRRESNYGLREAVRLAFNELMSQVPLNVARKQAWAVPLGEDDTAVPLYCWILLEDGKTMVSFDDVETLQRRIVSAREVFGLSPAQTELARLIVDGHDLAAASALLGVSINTLRTQLQRIFDKTGVRNRAALVRALLSAEAPTK